MSKIKLIVYLEIKDNLTAKQKMEVDKQLRDIGNVAVSFLTPYLVKPQIALSVIDKRKCLSIKAGELK